MVNAIAPPRIKVIVIYGGGRDILNIFIWVTRNNFQDLSLRTGKKGK
jgi:hypothetical protein